MKKETMKKETMTKEEIRLNHSIFNFLNNLVKKYPNDADLGEAIREIWINPSK